MRKKTKESIKELQSQIDKLSRDIFHLERDMKITFELREPQIYPSEAGPYGGYSGMEVTGDSAKVSEVLQALLTHLSLKIQEAPKPTLTPKYLIVPCAQEETKRNKAGR